VKMTRGGDTWRRNVEVTREVDSTSERFANVLGVEYFKKSIHQTLASRTQKFHPKSHPS